jgi:hypothetical protein
MKKTNKILYSLVFMLIASLVTVFITDIFDLSVFTSAAGSLPVAYALAPFITLEHESDLCNMAGIATIIYVIRVSDIQSFPAVAGADAEGKVSYSGNFVLKTNKYWNTYYSTQQMAQLKSEVAGPRDGKSWNITGSFFYPNTSKKAIGMANLFANSDVVIIMKEFSGGGQMRVIGNMDLPASINASEDSGKSFTDQKGITFNFEAVSCTPAKVYEGTIITENEILYSPVRMAVDANTIDVYASKRFVVGANTGLINLTSILNMVPGDRVHISFDISSGGTLVFAGAFGATATINASGEFFVIEKTDNNEIVIIDRLFS